MARQSRNTTKGKTTKAKAVSKPSAPKRSRKPAAKKEKRKIAVICGPGLDNHLAEVTDLFKKKYEVMICVSSDLEKIFNAVKWADTIWIEWANQTAVDVTSLGHLMYQKQVILRLHSYEAFQQELSYIHWNYITDLIFVADHIKDLVLMHYPLIQDAVDNIHVIPNGIDTKKFAIPKGREYVTKPGKNIAYLGYINFKKGPLLMFNAFAELIRNDPEFVLHIGGAFQEPRYVQYLKQLQSQNPMLQKQIRFHGWIDDPATWLTGMSHVICTSVLESQAKFVMEGMAVGLKPLIHNFVGAKDIYPTGLIWDTITDFCTQALSPSYNALSYRAFIVRYFNTDDVVKKIDAVIQAKDKPVELFKTGEVDPVTLSATIIMRNEEHNLARCLESIKDICDEIVIVDNGREDRGPEDTSLEIAEQYGAKVFDHYCKPEDFDFSIYRNLAVEYATGDWMLTIDCDEELKGDKAGLKQMLATLTPEYNAASMKLEDTDKELGSQVNASRVFRSGHVKYERAWHNIPIVDGMKKFGIVLYDDIAIVHHGSINQLDEALTKAKNLRTKLLLEKSLKQNPDDHELYFYMMQTYGIEEKWQAAVNCGEKYLMQRHKISSFRLEVYYPMIRAYLIELKHPQRALELLHEAMILLPEDLDIAFAECEIGVVTGNGNMLMSGARRFTRLYDVFKKRPDAKAGRFLYHLKPDSLLFCLTHMTSYQMQDGVECVRLLQGSISEFPEDRRIAVEEEIAEMLGKIGVNTN